MYTEEGCDINGLTIYHSLRGTNCVEGAVHNPIRRNFASLNASVELGDAPLADFRHQHNLDVGTKHKTGSNYSGHYDPWLDHDITVLRADVCWKSKPIIIPNFQDTDPLSFAQTGEKFGTTSIPTDFHMSCNFGGPEPNTPSQDLSLKVSHVYPTKLQLSTLKGTRGDVYTYLAAAQNTKFAVTPFHTKEEFQLFHQAVSVGGEWCVPQRQPNFDNMASWWSAKTNGKTIFYKLPEYLSGHYKKWLAKRQEKETLVASEIQRRPHQTHIRAEGHVAEVLRAANRRQPGILVQAEGQVNDHNLMLASSFSNMAQPLPNPETEPTLPAITGEEHIHLQDLDMDYAETSTASAAIQSTVSTTLHQGQMHDVTPPQQMAPYMPIVQTQWPSYRMATPILAPIPSQSSSAVVSWNSQYLPAFQAEGFGAARQRQSRRCHACLAAGRDGLDCPGNNKY